MVANILAVIMWLSAFRQRLVDNISPARRRQIKAQQLRTDFYNGTLLRQRAEIDHQIVLGSQLVCVLSDNKR